MDPLSLTASIAGLVQISGFVISQCYDYGCAVSTAPTEQRQLLTEITTLSGLLLGLQSRVNSTSSDISDRTPRIAGMHDVVRECQVILRGIADELDIRNASEEVQEKQGGRESIKRKLGIGVNRALWPLKRKETMELVAKLERQKATLTMALSTDTLSFVEETMAHVKGIQLTLEATKLEEEKARRLERKRATLKWLSEVNYQNKHTRASSQQMPGTGAWLVESKEMMAWLREPKAFLWLYGIPGSGKTVLTSHILNECILPFRSDTDMIAYFYCDFRDANSQRPESVLGALLCQLSLQLKCWPSIIDESMKRHTSEDGRTNVPTYAELESLLIQVLNSTEGPDNGRITLVVDALDECNGREKLLQLLSSIHETVNNVRVFVTSRREPDIQQIFTDFPQVCLQESVVDNDVRTYVEHTMKTNAAFRKLSDSLREFVAKSLVLRCNGMFRWVQCQVQELSTLRTDKAVRQALKSLPRDLDETYERILSRINHNDAVMAKRALTWLAYAARPLLLEELAEAAVLEEGTRELDPEVRLRDPLDIIEVCGSLVLHRNTTGEVVLAHHSVKDFLRSKSALTRVEFYHMQDISSNAEVAKSCLTYLLLRDFATGPATSGKELLQRYINYPLLDYSARHWCDHAVLALSDDKELHSLAMDLMDPKCTPNFFAWIQELVSDRKDLRPISGKYTTWATPLYFASSFGLIDVVKSLLKAGVNINERGGSFGGTALHAAVWRNHPEIVQLLIEAGADHTVKDVNLATAHDLARFKRTRSNPYAR